MPAEAVLGESMDRSSSVRPVECLNVWEQQHEAESGARIIVGEAPGGVDEHAFHVSCLGGSVF
jgi:hypothetical protein